MSDLPKRLNEAAQVLDERVDYAHTGIEFQKLLTEAADAIRRVEGFAAKIEADKGLDGNLGLVTAAIATEIRRALNG